MYISYVEFQEIIHNPYASHFILPRSTPRLLHIPPHLIRMPNLSLYYSCANMIGQRHTPPPYLLTPTISYNMPVHEDYTHEMLKNEVGWCGNLGGGGGACMQLPPPPPPPPVPLPLQMCNWTAESGAASDFPLLVFLAMRNWLKRIVSCMAATHTHAHTCDQCVLME